MEIGTGLVIGLVVGAVAGFIIVRMMLGKKKQQLIDEMNAKADQEIKQAQQTAKRIIQEAEEKNESIKPAFGIESGQPRTY